jgi:hypothetical protein
MSISPRSSVGTAAPRPLLQHNLGSDVRAAPHTPAQASLQTWAFHPRAMGVMKEAGWLCDRQSSGLESRGAAGSSSFARRGASQKPANETETAEKRPGLLTACWFLPTRHRAGQQVRGGWPRLISLHGLYLDPPAYRCWPTRSVWPGYCRL